MKTEALVKRSGAVILLSNVEEDRNPIANASVDYLAHQKAANSFGSMGLRDVEGTNVKSRRCCQEIVMRVAKIRPDPAKESERGTEVPGPRLKEVAAILAKRKKTDDVLSRRRENQPIWIHPAREERGAFVLATEDALKRPQCPSDELRGLLNRERGVFPLKRRTLVTEPDLNLESGHADSNRLKVATSNERLPKGTGLVIAISGIKPGIPRPLHRHWPGIG